MRWLERVVSLKCRGLLMAVLVLCSSTLMAHDARPVAVRISESLPGIFQYSIQVPPTVELDNQPVLNWPASCSAVQDSNSIGSTQLMSCPDGLDGQSLTLVYPLFNPSLATYYSLRLLDQSVLTAMLAPTQASWQVPTHMSRSNVAGEYLQLGMEHIIGGVDHLLFVLGLLVIARTFRRVLLTITGFTIAHSLSLTLAAMGLVNIPIVPVEAVIALSIVFLAYEIALQNKKGLTYRYPVLVSFGFGLLHGLGFASALNEIGLAESGAVLSLLFFNLGVELGQVFFIAVVMLFIGLILYLSKHFTKLQLKLGRKADIMSAYAIGIPATFWLLDRIGQFA